MSKNFFGWVVEAIIWYLFFYAIVFSTQNPVNPAWVAFVLLILASFGIFASPITRHLSIWNKILDKTIKKKEDDEGY